MTPSAHIGGDRWEGWIPACDCDRCEVARLEAIVPAVRELRQEVEVRRLGGEGSEGRP